VYNEPPVKAPYPVGFIGDGVTRSVVLALPAATVRGLLPASLQLAEQDLTPPGTHPVVFLFHDFTQCQFSFPTFLQPMRFHEQTFGIPFTRVRAGLCFQSGSGPYYFMPRLYLDDLWVLMVGRNLWGFDKQLASVRLTADRFAVASLPGRPLVSLDWSGSQPPLAPVDLSPEFDPVRRILDQPLLTLSPAAVGPFLTLTDFDRRWNLAALRPLRARLDVDDSYLRGLPAMSCVTEARSGDSGLSLPAAFEFSAQWWLSFLYPVPFDIPRSNRAAGPATRMI
jgi:hypothetical protein